mmetsp:Transcript_3814/g.8903  ORF Transcript_3814/g.8903 Transcript_3814/m.8903 type:complete len:205 (+) Transcript_3814:906-1520(+)
MPLFLRHLQYVLFLRGLRPAEYPGRLLGRGAAVRDCLQAAGRYSDFANPKGLLWPVLYHRRLRHKYPPRLAEPASRTQRYGCPSPGQDSHHLLCLSHRWIEHCELSADRLPALPGGRVYLRHPQCSLPSGSLHGDAEAAPHHHLCGKPGHDATSRIGWPRTRGAPGAVEGGEPEAAGADLGYAECRGRYLWLWKGGQDDHRGAR